MFRPDLPWHKRILIPKEDKAILLVSFMNTCPLLIHGQGDLFLPDGGVCVIRANALKDLDYGSPVNITGSQQLIKILVIGPNETVTIRHHEYIRDVSAKKHFFLGVSGSPMPIQFGLSVLFTGY